MTSLPPQDVALATNTASRLVRFLRLQVSGRALVRRTRDVVIVEFAFPRARLPLRAQQELVRVFAFPPRSSSSVDASPVPDDQPQSEELEGSTMIADSR